MSDRDLAIELMKAGKFSSALSLFRRLIKKDSSDWSANYMAGQCCRFLNDFAHAIRFLDTATKLKPDEPPIFLALGIVHQLGSNLPQAVEAFKSAIQLDPDYELAYNSLALTQKKMGQLELALHNYDAGIKALTRRLVKAMFNNQSNRICKYEHTPQDLWVEYAAFGAMYLCSTNHIIVERLAWTTGEQAIEEERTEAHGGLYWIDTRSIDGKSTRLFLPNYFDTFRETLKQEQAYSNLVGNRGTVLELMGRTEEANKHFEEAKYFSTNAP